jgi:hypothetical protein
LGLAVGGAWGRRRTFDEVHDDSADWNKNATSERRAQGR